MNVFYLPKAKDELDEAIAHHQRIQAKLGVRFARAYREAFQKIEDQPQAWPRLSGNMRCCRLKKFKYGILYQVRSDQIVIVAVMHLHRKPGYWRNRL